MRRPLGARRDENLARRLAEEEALEAADAELARRLAWEEVAGAGLGGRFGVEDLVWL